MSSKHIYVVVCALVLTQVGATPPRARHRQAPLQLFEAVEPHMGTLVQLKLYARNGLEAQAAMRQAFERIAALDNILSDYKPDSELNRLCRVASDHPIRVSTDLFRVITASQQLAAQTNGAFDITVGPLTHLWRKARQLHQLPDPNALRDAIRHCGYRKLHLDHAAQTIGLDQPGMQLDVGGIGKGYAADEAIAVLRRHNIQNALVSVSGDLAFSNAPPGQPGWRIGIDSVTQTGGPAVRVLFLKDGAASTSGDSEQHLDIGGVRYSHTIDPHTGWALTKSVTATVLARTDLEADGQATALTIMGADQGLNFIQRHTASAALIVVKNEGFAEVKESFNFASFTPVS